MRAASRGVIKSDIGASAVEAAGEDKPQVGAGAGGVARAGIGAEAAVGVGVGVGVGTAPPLSVRSNREYLQIRLIGIVIHFIRLSVDVSVKSSQRNIGRRE